MASHAGRLDYFDAAMLAAMEDISVVSGKTSREQILSAIEGAGGGISPPDDGRFTIRWDLVPQAETGKQGVRRAGPAWSSRPSGPMVLL